MNATAAAPSRRSSGLRPSRRALLLAPPAVAGASVLGGCGALRSIIPGGGGSEEDLRSDVDPAAPPTPEEIRGRLLPFTTGMLSAFGTEGTSAVLSPLSVLVALAMTAQGAEGETLAQLQEVLRDDAAELAATASCLRSVLAAVGKDERENREKGDPEPASATLVDALWIQDGYEVQQDYLNALARGFDTGLHTADFQDPGGRDRAREDINSVVDDATEGRIPELLAEDVLTDLTRLVLVDALHVKAAWPDALVPMEPVPFTLTDGTTADIDMLGAEASSWYEDAQLQATRLDTFGDEVALVLARPVGDIPAVLEHWRADGGAALGTLLDGLEDGGDAEVDLVLPPVDLRTATSVKKTLTAMGLELAFGDDADVTGISTQEDLRIGAVIHEAVITVDEEGMEAAAATAVVTEAGAAPRQEEPKRLVLDRPFLFLVTERSTRAPLVVGWTADPRQKG